MEVYDLPLDVAHITRSGQLGMHSQGFANSVGSLRLAVGQFQVIPQQLLVVGVSAVFDDGLGTLLRTLAAEVGYALLGDDDIDVVLCMVVVRNHRTMALILPSLATDGQVKMEI